MVRLCFNLELPDEDLRIGVTPPPSASLVERGWFGRDRLDMSQRSSRGSDGRQWRRFFPIILALECLCQENEWQLARYALDGNPLPRLYHSGVVYQEEPPGEEEWLDIATLYKQRWGDCEDVACARVAERRFYDHVPCVPCIRFATYTTKKGRLTLIHVLNLEPDGTIEDPSKLLGMRGTYS